MPTARWYGPRPMNAGSTSMLIVTAGSYNMETYPQFLQAGKLKIFGTRPNWVVAYIAYTKFHSPRPVFHSPGQIFTRIGERASISFPSCSCHAEFIWGTIKIHLPFLSFLYTETGQVYEILPPGRQKSTCIIQSTPWLQISCFRHQHS